MRNDFRRGRDKPRPYDNLQRRSPSSPVRWVGGGEERAGVMRGNLPRTDKADKVEAGSPSGIRTIAYPPAGTNEAVVKMRLKV